MIDYFTEGISFLRVSRVKSSTPSHKFLLDFNLFGKRDMLIMREGSMFMGACASGHKGSDWKLTNCAHPFAIALNNGAPISRASSIMSANDESCHLK